jgi:lysozyme family protein
MTPAFKQADAVVALMEGGHANSPHDAGGDTWYGISRRWHPKEEPWPPTVQRAQQIRFEEYWCACRCDELPLYVALLVYDMAMTSAPEDAIKLMQQTVKVPVDGVIGPVTLLAAKKMLPAEYLAARALAMTTNSTFVYNGRGWFRRLFTLAAVQL